MGLTQTSRMPVAAALCLPAIATRRRVAASVGETRSPTPPLQSEAATVATSLSIRPLTSHPHPPLPPNILARESRECARIWETL